MSLLLNWCDRKAARYACEHWHYSKKLPVFKLNCIGVWEDEKYKGALVFSLGAAGACNGAKYGMKRNFEIAELARVALNKPLAPVSKIVSVAIKMIARHNPGLKMLISFADTREGHVGTIYQASNWVYAGTYDSSCDTYVVRGKEVHAKTLYSRYGRGGQSIPWLREHIDPTAQRIKSPPKHRYLYPLCSGARKVIESFRKPYPKRAGGVTSSTPADQAGGGGANPTSALSSEVA